LKNAERFSNVDVDFSVNVMSSDLALFNRFCDIIVLKAVFVGERTSSHEILEEFREFLELIHIILLRGDVVCVDSVIIGIDYSERQLA
jgi:hypothetical protein